MCVCEGAEGRRWEKGDQTWIAYKKGDQVTWQKSHLDRRGEPSRRVHLAPRHTFGFYDVSRVREWGRRRVMELREHFQLRGVFAWKSWVSWNLNEFQTFSKILPIEVTLCSPHKESQFETLSIKWHVWYAGPATLFVPHTSSYDKECYYVQVNLGPELSMWTPSFVRRGSSMKDFCWFVVESHTTL